MKKMLLLVLPSLLQLMVCLMLSGSVRLMLCCVLVMFQGGICAWQKQGLVLGMILSLLAYMPNLDASYQMISIIYLLVLNGLAYFCIKTIRAIYQK